MMQVPFVFLLLALMGVGFHLLRRGHITPSKGDTVAGFFFLALTCMVAVALFKVRVFFLP
jgi:hypothetical protein